MPPSDGASGQPSATGREGWQWGGDAMAQAAAFQRRLDAAERSTRETLDNEVCVLNQAMGGWFRVLPVDRHS